MRQGKHKLLWHWLAVVYVWHVGGDVDDETAFVALTRLKAWIDEALGILQEDPGDVPEE